MTGVLYRTDRVRTRPQ